MKLLLRLRLQITKNNQTNNSKVIYKLRENINYKLSITIYRKHNVLYCAKHFCTKRFVLDDNVLYLLFNHSLFNYFLFLPFFLTI